MEEIHREGREDFTAKDAKDAKEIQGIRRKNLTALPLPDLPHFLRKQGGEMPRFLSSPIFVF
jgi:hypothetical protein